MKYKTKDMDFKSFLLILILVFAPFSALKVSFFGIPEISTILIFIILLMNKKLKLSSNLFVVFWLIFIFLVTIGFVNNYVVKNHVSGTLNSALVDFYAYIFIMFTIVTLDNLFSKMNYNHLLKILKYIYIFSVLSIGFLYFYANYISSSFLGMSLFHYQAFRPLATNIHHISMYFAPLPFIGLMFISKRKSIFINVLYIFSIALIIIISLDTNSTKVGLAFITGTTVFLISVGKRTLESKQFKIVISIFTLILLISVVYAFKDVISNYLYDFFVENDQSSARSYLYSSSIEKILKAPIFGYGPGPHSVFIFEDIFLDAHQTMLTVTIQGGVFALISLFILIYFLIKKMRYNIYFLSALSSILVYALGGDIMRRSSVWVLIMMMYYIQKKTILGNKEDVII